jgi:sulfonate transport system substrate-binding protein
LPIVRAFNAALRAEADWANNNHAEAEHIVQRKVNYSDQIRDQFIANKRNFQLIAVTDQKFVGELQWAADWLTARKVLPEPVEITDHLATV